MFLDQFGVETLSIVCTPFLQVSISLLDIQFTTMLYIELNNLLVRRPFPHQPARLSGS
jgi:hypothetical protein